MKKAYVPVPAKIRHPFLKGLSSKYLALILKNADTKTLYQGYHIFRDNEKAEKFFLILSGGVNIMADEQDVRFDSEKRKGVFQFLKAGEVIGWSWLIPPYRWRFDAVADSETQLLVIDAVQLRKAMLKDCRLANEIYKRLIPVMNSRLVASRLKLLMFGAQPFTSVEGA